MSDTTPIEKARHHILAGIFAEAKLKCSKRGRHQWISVDEEGVPVGARGVPIAGKLCWTCFEPFETPAAIPPTVIAP